MSHPLRLVLLGLLLVALPTHAQTPEPTGPAPGDPVPEAALTLELLHPAGDSTTLGELWGTGGALLVFTSNTCPYSLDWLDRLPRLAERAAEGDIAFVAINSNARKRKSDDSPEAMAELAAEHDFTFPYLVDPDSRLADALGARRTPEVYLFDAERTLVYRGALDDHSGPFENVTEHWARSALDQLLAGEEVVVPTTQALGCAVQRPRRRR
jgi:peroxiredoxin